MTRADSSSRVLEGSYDDRCTIIDVVAGQRRRRAMPEWT